MAKAEVPRAAHTAVLPSERLQKLLIDTNRPEPYPITAELSIDPPTKKRRDELRESQMEIAIAQQLLDQMMNHVLPARPEFPAPPEPPAAAATAKQHAAYEASTGNYNKLVDRWHEQNTDWEKTVTRHQSTMNALADKITEHSHRYTRALFGPVYEDVTAFFDDQPPDLWDAFQIDLQEHFRIIAKAPEVPADGRCPECGHIVDEDEAADAGK